MKKLYISLLSALVICLALLTGAKAQTWTRVYGAPTSYGNKIIHLQDGGYLVAGTTDAYGSPSANAYIIKTDSLGYWQWQQTIGNANNEEGYDAAQTDNGDIFIITSSNYYYNYYNTDSGFLLTRFDHSGNIRWTENLGSMSDENAYSISASGNDVFITGKTDNTSNGTGDDVFLMKVDTAGTVLWQKTYGGAHMQVGLCIAKLNDGGFLIGGSASYPADTNDLTAYAIRTDATGDTLWTKTGLAAWSNSYLVGYYGCTQLQGDSLLVLAGWTDTYYLNMIGTILDMNGNLRHNYQSSALDDNGYDIAATNDGGFIVAGLYGNFGGYGKAFKFSYNGDLIYEKVYGGVGGLSLCPTYEWLDGVIAAPDGGLVFCGGTGIFNPQGKSQLLIMKTDAYGTANVYHNEIITASDSTSFCKGDSVILTASTGYDHYQWYWFDNASQTNWIPNSDTTSIIADSSGSYICLMWKNDVISFSNNIQVHVSDMPDTVISSTGPLSHCAVNDTISLFVRNLLYTNYTWYLDGNPLPGNSYRITPAVTGTYSVTVSNSCGSLTSPGKFVNTNSPPVISLDTASIHFPYLRGAGVSCSYHTFIVSPDPGTAYTWYHDGIATGWSQATDSVNEQGAYYVTAQNSCGTGTSNTAHAAYDTLNLSYSTPLSGVCDNVYETFTAPDGGWEYKWYKNDTLVANTGSTNQFQPGFFPYGSGYYYCMISINCGGASITAYTDTVHYIESNANYGMFITGTNPSCNGNPVQLQAYPSSALQFQWYRNDTLISGATTNVYSADSTGYYRCSMIIPCDTVSTGNYYILFGPPVASNSVISVFYGTSTICRTVNDTTDVHLMISNAYGQVQWQLNHIDIPGATSSYFYYANIAGWYECVITNACGSVVSDSFYVSEQFLPAFHISPSGYIYICPGSTQNLSIALDSGLIYQWYKSSTLIAGATSNLYTASEQATYYCHIMGAGCSVYSDFTYIGIQPLPLNNILPFTPPEICEDSVRLNANEGFDYTYQWYKDAVPVAGAVQKFYYSTEGGDYSVKITDSIGCFSVSTPITVTDSSLGIIPVSVISGNVDCSGNPIVLSAPQGYLSYQWFYGDSLLSGGAANNVTVSSGGLYSVVVSNSSGCTGGGSYSLTVLEPPVCTYHYAQPEECNKSNGGISLYFGGAYIKVIINGPNGFNDTLYSQSSYGNAIYLSQLKAGWYIYMYSYPNGSCSVTDSIEVPSAMPSIYYYDTTACQGQSIYLSSSGIYTHYLWSTGQTSSYIYATVTGMYILTISDTTGCTAQDSAFITIFPLPAANITPSGPVSLCTGNSITLDAGAGNYLYAWSNGQYSQTVNAVAGGLYIVTLTDTVSTCINRDTVQVTIHPPPKISIDTSSAVNMCAGNSITPYIYPVNGQYLWSTGETTMTIIPLTSGIYILTVTDTLTGCSARDSVSITVSALPLISISPQSPVNVCTVQPVTLSATSGFSNYLWSNGLTDSVIVAASPGNYSVIVTGANGCSNSDTTTVSWYPVPPVSITPSGTIYFCLGQTLTLNATFGYPLYQWSDGQTTSSIAVSLSGNYTVTITDVNGCSNSDSVIVNQYPLLSATSSFTNPTCSSCCDGTATITPSSGTPPYTFLWSNGQTTQTATGLCNGNYSVAVFDSNWCFDSTSFSFTVGINQQLFASSGFEIFPNPTTDKLNIKGHSTDVGYLEIKLNNVLGQELMKVYLKISSPSIETAIDLKDVAGGIYFLSISSEKTKEVFKIQKN